MECSSCIDRQTCHRRRANAELYGLRSFDAFHAHHNAGLKAVCYDVTSAVEWLMAAAKLQRWRCVI